MITDLEKGGGAAVGHLDEEALASLAADSSEDPLLREHATGVILALAEEALVDFQDGSLAADLLLRLAEEVQSADFAHVGAPVDGRVVAHPALALAPLDRRVLQGPAVEEAHGGDEWQSRVLEEVPDAHLDLRPAVFLVASPAHLLFDVQLHLMTVLAESTLWQDPLLLQEFDCLRLGARQLEEVHRLAF